MIDACNALGIVARSDIYVSDDFPLGVGKRIVIHAKRQLRGDVFYKGFVEVNVVIPDNGDKPDHNQLEDAERILDDAFRYDTVGEYDGQSYRYGLHSMEVIKDGDSHYHYVNARLTFESLNI